MYKVVIVEDDPKHIETLQKHIKQSELPLSVLSICLNVETAQKAINEFKPELVFLDVELEEGLTAFDLLKFFKKIEFDIIFTTSHIGEYINEIRACGLSYLPKPVIREEFEEALNKFETKRNGKLGILQANSLLNNYNIQNVDEKTIWIPSGFDYAQVMIKNIIYCEADNQYTKFYIDMGQKDFKSILASRGIGEWEKDLEHFRICRIHKQYLVNLKHVKKYTRGEGGTVTLFNDKSLPVSKTGKDRFLRLSGLA